MNSFVFFGLILLELAWAGDKYPMRSTDKYNNGFPEQKYHIILDRFEAYYGQVISDLGGTFVIWRDWSDGAVNMWAERWGDQYILEVPGGMARYSLIVEDAFILSICHELGHLLGGEPAQGDISVEGQSDYFATNECLPKMLKRIEPLLGGNKDPDVESFCEKPQVHGKVLCLRSMQGAKSLTAYYAELANQKAPQIDESSSTVVLETLQTHPEPQCRLDTFKAGWLDWPRPSCWYSP